MNPICKGDFDKRNGEHVPPHEPVEMLSQGMIPSGYTMRRLWRCRKCLRRTTKPEVKP